MEAHKHKTTVFSAMEATWRDAQAPDLAAGLTTGQLRSCSYCGSMHPADLAAALRAGARADWADWKYGWPHKLYVDDVPNPHVGQLESRMSTSHAVPVCPRSGAACEHGEQSFRTAKCECMKAGSPTEAIADRGERMIRIQDGFRREDGAPEYRWTQAGKPAAATTWGNFYTEHLQDAEPQDRKVIERAMGLNFTFEGGRVAWAPFKEDIV
jgi:hypothetical protein